MTAPQEPLSCPELERYWNDPAYRARVDAERAEWQRQTHALLNESIERARLRRLAERGVTA